MPADVEDKVKEIQKMLWNLYDKVCRNLEYSSNNYLYIIELKKEIHKLKEEIEKIKNKKITDFLK